LLSLNKLIQIDPSMCGWLIDRNIVDIIKSFDYRLWFWNQAYPNRKLVWMQFLDHCHKGAWLKRYRFVAIQISVFSLPITSC